MTSPRQHFHSLLPRTLKYLMPVALIASMLPACSEPSTGEDTSAANTPDYNLTLDMADFMTLVLDPASDVIWGSAGWVDDIDEGYYELYPTDDAGWERVRQQAATIVEIGNALMLPGRAPTQAGTWRTYSQAMSTVGLSLMEAVDNRDKDALFQGGAQLYSVCTACHQAYNPDVIASGRLTE